jgi:hypothetical protein
MSGLLALDNGFLYCLDRTSGPLTGINSVSESLISEPLISESLISEPLISESLTRKRLRVGPLFSHPPNDSATHDRWYCSTTHCGDGSAVQTFGIRCRQVSLHWWLGRELDFEHANLLGGGETLGVVVRRGTSDATPSVRLKFSNGRLGLEGGYDVEAFNEYIGDEGKSTTHSSSRKVLFDY